MLSTEVKERIASGGLDDPIARLCACDRADAAPRRERFLNAVGAFEALYGEGRDIAIFSAPGRTEIGGNHTDHQRGRVLAASVNLDVIAVVARREDGRIRIKSEGHSADELEAADTEMREEERGGSASLIRGVCARFRQIGYKPGGFDAYTTSEVLSGSGLSSSAAFEVLIGTIINSLYCSGGENAVSIAQIAQYAENVYFGKPCGLMDQAASSVGGFIQIDFADAKHPEVHRLDYDFAQSGCALCIIDTKGSHSDLTPDYAAIPAEMREVAAYFGKEVLRDVDEDLFYGSIAALREKMGDRAVLRAIHFFGDNARVLDEADALDHDDFERFKRLVIESGRSSYQYLQNAYSPAHPQQQGVSLILALCERLLERRRGAWRVHGGGFAGTVQAFVPQDYLAEFVNKMEAVTGKGSCHILRVRPVGGVRIL